MNWQTIDFDWNQIRAFLATVDEGSFSAAARVLGSTQPTVSRQIAALESALAVKLFQRGRRSMTLTAAGAELVDHVRAMADAATRVSLAASGQALEAEGLVTITATSFTAARFLPRIVQTIAHEAPGIEIEIIASNDIRDLNKREADIALRHARPDHPDLIARQIHETPAFLYANKTWLDRVGHPRSLDDLAGLSFIGFDRPDRVETRMADSGLPIRRQDVRYRSDSGEVILELVRAGLGISVLPTFIAGDFDDIEPILQTEFSATVPTWLVTHSELRTSNRVRVVFDLIAKFFDQTETGGPMDRPL